MSSRVGARKRLLFVTGTRADFGKLEPLAKTARAAGFHVSFFITGMHMMARYGETRYEVKRFDGADFFEFVNQREGDTLDFILSKTVLGFSDFVHEHKPDLVIIHGDRVEALSASIVCSLNNILSGHIEGGEVSGTVDEMIRHCNTKLCATHFVCSSKAKQRVLDMGEANDRIFHIGSPELDVHAAPSRLDIEEVKKRYEIPFDKYGIVIFHPVVSEIETIHQQADCLFSTLSKSKKKFVVISPNNDPGSEYIFEVLTRLSKAHFKVIPSMRFLYFSELMKNSEIMIGNSSTIVREAPFLGLCSINIGTRQFGRAQSNSVFDCSPFDVEKLMHLLIDKWGKRNPISTDYGSGNSSSRFLEAISSRDFWSLDAQKYYSEE